MSIKLRLALLLGLLLLAFAVSLFVLRVFERQQAEQVIANTRQGRIDLLERWLALSGESLRQFANDYSQWDDLVAYVEHPDPQWAQINIDAMLGNFNAHAAWILHRDGSAVHAVSRLKGAKLPELPLPVPDFLALAGDTPFMHFFAPTPAGLLELRGAPIQPSADAARATPAPGWFLVGRLWDDSQLRTLGQLTEGTASITDPSRPAQSPAPLGEGQIHVIRPLVDWRGRTVRLLEFDYYTPEVAQISQANASEARVFAGFGLIVICALALGLHRWVLRPLNWISDSLARSDTTPIRPLLRENEKTELGRVALLIESAFAQRRQLMNEVKERESAEAALRHTIDERARLGRDLHDGVIQSLYGTGMALAATRAQLRDDLGEAETRIDQACAALNDTIREVRSFISGLEPETVKETSFAHSVERVIDLLKATKPLATSITIDEPLAASLSIDQQAHLLLIAREAVSNAVRHGQANHIRLALERRGDRIEFAINDDGAGFDPAAVDGQGHGLKNLADRARLLEAELQISSEPGKGTQVLLTMPPSTAP